MCHAAFLHQYFDMRCALGEGENEWSYALDWAYGSSAYMVARRSSSGSSSLTSQLFILVPTENSRSSFVMESQNCTSQSQCTVLMQTNRRVGDGA